MAHPSSALSASEMSSIKIENIGEIEEDGSNITSLSLAEEDDNSTQLSNDHDCLATNMTSNCDYKKYSTKTQKNTSDMLPKFKNQDPIEAPWRKVVVTIDDDNNIIEENIEQNEKSESNLSNLKFFLNGPKSKKNVTEERISSELQITNHRTNRHLNHEGQDAKQIHDLCSHCSVCKLVFTSETQLAEHRLAYADRIACCHCCKTFATMSKLRVHHRKHSKEKPFQVNIYFTYQ